MIDVEVQLQMLETYAQYAKCHSRVLRLALPGLARASGPVLTSRNEQR
jgi:hypothetical protein